MFAEGYSKIYWYLKDTYFGPGQDIFLHNALIDEASISPKPAFYSYKTMISKVDSFNTITKLATWQYRYDFTNKGPVYALWCNYGTCPLPSEISGLVKVTDYMGSVQIIQASQIILDSIPIFVESGLTSVNENNSLQNHVSIYPNPAYTSITVSIPLNGKSENVLKDASLTVYNSFGQPVKQIKNISEQTVTFSCDNLPGGLYFIRITGDNKIYTNKLVKQ